MSDSIIWENENRKVVGETRFDMSRKKCNSLTFYEDGRKVVCVVLSNIGGFFEFDSKQFKQLSGYSFINTFLEQGIGKMTIRNILNCFIEVNGDSWGVNIYLKNGVSYYRHCFEKNGRLYFSFKSASCVADLLDYNVTYHELNDLIISDIWNYVDIDSIKILHLQSFNSEIGKFCFEDYGFKIPINNDVFFYIKDIKNLKRIDFFNTGHFFKLTDDTKKELAKRKLLTGEVPVLTAIDSNGYGIFEGIPYKN